MNKITQTLFTSIAFLITSCATYSPQYVDENFSTSLPQKDISKTFYLIGDAGGAKEEIKTPGLETLREVIKNEDTKEDYLIFLGDNIYPKGLPKKNGPKRKEAEYKIDAQVDAAKDFEGKTIFIPGNHDWYNNGVEGLDRERKYVEKQLQDKKSFWPSDGCSIKSIEVNDQIQLIILDTQWFLADWNKNPTINDDCDIKTRDAFFVEFQGELKKNDGKTVIVAMHHPMFTNGPHGGKYAFRNHIFPSKKKIPLPVLGSLATQMLAQGGVSPQDRYNQRYNQLMRRLSTMARDHDHIIFTSGHEHSLQYIDDDGLKQIVSGSGSKNSQASLGNNGLFSYPDQGMAVLDIYTDGSSNVRYYGYRDNKATLVFQTKVHDKNEEFDVSTLPNSFENEISEAIYEKEETDKSGFFKMLWGDHYRNIYSTDIRVPIATLDTLKGGFTIERQGGGQVTRSLRLVDKEGKRYSLRAMRKSVTQFLQKGAFVNTYLEDSFDDTFTEELLADFYTSSYPYAFLTVGKLADAIDVYHANPELYYIPKHPALGDYNKTFGNEMYFLEERPGKEFGDTASFGKPDDIEGTDDLLSKLRKDEEYVMDEAHYIRTRLFDMLLGDWDRHPDQWRWARFDSEEEKIYRPVPKDRDQVFSNYDGALLNTIKKIIPVTRKFQVYDGDINNVRWINESGIRLDRLLAKESTRNVWLEQAELIKTNITDTVIEAAFRDLPIELQDNVAERIKGYLRKRRDEMKDVAGRYYDYLSRQVIITGTDKDDLFEIIRQDHQTQIRVYRIKKGKTENPIYNRTIYTNETKEIWVYGLDDDDQFIVKGIGKNPIPIRIIGGQNNDIYTIENGKKVKVYDHKTKPNTINKKGGARFTFSNDYDYNTYDFNKYIDQTNTLTPLFGFNPDDGFNINLTNVLTARGFKNNPFQSKHTIKAAYFFATEGYDISYKGEFAKIIGLYNLFIGGRYTSENYALNFFGFGNETKNLDDEFGLDYNRVKTGIYSFSLGVSKKGFYGDDFYLKTSFEGIEVQDTANRFITSDSPGLEFIQSDTGFFERKYFAGLELNYGYKSYDNPVNPTRGMLFDLLAGVKSNIEDSNRTFGYFYPKLGFYNALTNNRKLVLRTEASAQIIVGDEFEFYQGASLGGLNGLRGYREERFVGQRALAFSADLRYSFNKFKTGLMPLQLGVFGGYDLGRVWLDGEDSEIWHDSVGGGMWINAVDAISGEFGLFNSDDGLRFTFGLKFSL